jgi:hypothetical protein
LADCSGAGVGLSGTSWIGAGERFAMINDNPIARDVTLARFMATFFET